MLICLNGGLGNQIGNYIFARYLKEEFGEDVKFVWSNNANKIRNIVLDKFNTDVDIAKKEDIEKFLSAKTDPSLVFDLLFKNIFDKIWVNNLWTLFNGIRSEYNIFPKKSLNLLSRAVKYKKALERKGGNVAVCDCYSPIKEFQNPKFKEKMRQHFTLKEEFDEKNAEMFEKIRSCENSVGIHIRRGDYIDFKIPVVKKEFISDKMKIIEERFPNSKFFIFSNGMGWAKENFQNIKNVEFADINDEAHGYLDFVLFNTCYHRIYSDSTFSLWARYFNPYKESMEFYPGTEDLTIEC